MTRRTLAILAMVLYIILVMIEASVSATLESRSHVLWGGCAVAAVGALLFLWMWRFRSQLPQHLLGLFGAAEAITIIGRRTVGRR